MRYNSAIIKGTIEAKRFLIPYRIYENYGPHILCINGVQQSMAMWHTFICRYAPHYRIVLFDFPDQGKGRVLSGPVFVTLDEQVEILREVKKATGSNNNMTICSASWGGIVAMAFASQYKHEVKKLCLASLGTRANDRMVKTIEMGSKMNPGDRQKMADILIESFGQKLPDKIKKKIVSQFKIMSEQNLRAFYEHGLFVISTKKIGDLINLSNIAAETFLIHGEKDTIIDPEDVDFLASQIPNCKVRVIKDAGHFLHMERDDVFDVYGDILPIPPPRHLAR